MEEADYISLGSLLFWNVMNINQGKLIFTLAIAKKESHLLGQHFIPPEPMMLESLKLSPRTSLLTWFPSSG